MKATNPCLAIIATCSFVLFPGGCASGPDGKRNGGRPEVEAQASAPSFSAAPSEEQVRQVLRQYKVGATTYKRFTSDATAGVWKLRLGGIGMGVVSGKVAVAITVSTAERDVCELLFEGEAPANTGKAPSLDKCLLKQITFKP